MFALTHEKSVDQSRTTFNEAAQLEKESSRLEPRNICAIIVTYHPDTHFRQRLDRIHAQVGKTIIVDNTADAEPRTLSPTMNCANAEVIRNRENLGIGAALNQGMERAIQLGYKWAITFDQDTWVHPDLLEVLTNIHERQPRPELVGILGCNFEDENIHKTLMEFKIDGPIFSEIESVITSGSLISTTIYSKVGPFRADFFIDFVDHEYCLRLRKLGYKVLIAAQPLMLHALGSSTILTVGKRTGKFSLVLTNRSPLRRYYATRNALLVAKEYFTFAPKWVLRSLASVLGFAVLKIPLENSFRWKKLVATLAGAFDAVRSKHGKGPVGWLEK
jgi:rhamnosyltransferase